MGQFFNIITKIKENENQIKEISNGWGITISGIRTHDPIIDFPKPSIDLGFTLHLL